MKPGPKVEDVGLPYNVSPVENLYDEVHLAEYQYNNRHPKIVVPGVHPMKGIAWRKGEISWKRYCDFTYDPDDWLHGTWTGYSRFRCRCPDCLLARDDYQQSARGKLSSWLNNKARRARKRSLPSEPYSRQAVIDQQEGRYCWRCKKDLTDQSPWESPVDHLIPMAFEFPETSAVTHPGDVLANVAIACRPCNSSRSAGLYLDAYCLYCSRLDQTGEKESNRLTEDPPCARVELTAEKCA